MNPEPGPGQGAAGAGRGGAGDGVTYIFCPLNLLLPSVATAELRLRQLATGADGPPSPRPARARLARLLEAGQSGGYRDGDLSPQSWQQ